MTENSPDVLLAAVTAEAGLTGHQIADKIIHALN